MSVHLDPFFDLNVVSPETLNPESREVHCPQRFSTPCDRLFAALCVEPRTEPA